MRGMAIVLLVVCASGCRLFAGTPQVCRIASHCPGPLDCVNGFCERLEDNDAGRPPVEDGGPVVDLDKDGGVVVINDAGEPAVDAGVALDAGSPPLDGGQNPDAGLAEVCGDGVLETGETCDPGPRFDPGCSACQIEPGFVCYGTPQVCFPTGLPLFAVDREDPQGSIDDALDDGLAELIILVEPGEFDANINASADVVIHVVGEPGAFLNESGDVGTLDTAGGTIHAYNLHIGNSHGGGNAMPIDINNTGGVIRCTNCEIGPSGERMRMKGNGSLTLIRSWIHDFTSRALELDGLTHVENCLFTNINPPPADPVIDTKALADNSRFIHTTFANNGGLQPSIGCSVDGPIAIHGSLVIGGLPVSAGCTVTESSAIADQFVAATPTAPDDYRLRPGADCIDVVLTPSVNQQEPNTDFFGPRTPRNDCGFAER